MNAPETVHHNRATVRLVITAPLQHLCPFVEEVDNGTVTISWTTNGSTIELHSLRKYLEGFSQTKISHEELTGTIRGHVRSLGGILEVSVSTTWSTAGMDVVCST